ncbi:MAG TPA: hypothetical protein VII99_07510 [Bacteroidia bacterium]
MTKQDFIQYLSYPEKLNGHSIDSLEKLVRDYPYFQTGRMLYLKNLSNQNSIEYEKNLHITSAYTPGGKVLYNLIRKKAYVSDTENEDKQPITGNQPLIAEEKQKEVLLKEEAIVVPQVVPENKNLPATPEVEKSKQDEYDDLQLLEKEMLREAHRTSVIVDLSEKEYSSTSIKPALIEKTDHEKQVTELQHSFTDWIKIVSSETDKTSIQKKIYSPKLDEDAESEIIDRFILDATAKSAPKPKAEFYTAENMAKKSLQDNEVFVSETLAGIYLKQGNLPKALRAYEILIVKHPEKIHIFAPLLEKIKNLLENQKGK